MLSSEHGILSGQGILSGLGNFSYHDIFPGPGVFSGQTYKQTIKAGKPLIYKDS